MEKPVEPVAKKPVQVKKEEKTVQEAEPVKAEPKKEEKPVQEAEPVKAEPKKEEKPVQEAKPVPVKKKEPQLKLFDRWTTDGITIDDPGLKDYISLRPVIVPRTAGRQAKKQFYKSRSSLVERLMNHVAVSGHRGKRHLISSGKNTGKYATNWKTMKRMLEILEKRTKKNPVEILVKAIENAALREEVTSFQVGGIIARKAVITAPQRRIDLALRLISQTAYRKSKKNPKSIAECLADEILAAYENDSNKSVAIKEKERIEREAMGSR